VVIVAVILVALITAREWPLRASILVVLLGTIGLIIGLIQLYVETRPGTSSDKTKSGMDIEADEEQMGAQANRRTIAIWAWFGGLILGIWLIGFQIAVTAFAFAYSKVNGSRWLVALALAAVSYLLCWILFDVIIHIVWPEPLLKRIFAG
jgi:hypothetical protein